MITCGIDEAGRGPVIGPMVIACCSFDSGDKSIDKLRELKVRDSKELTPKIREFLEPAIKELCIEYAIKKISPVEIDTIRERISLNEIEAVAISDLILNLTKKPHTIYIDSPDPVEESFKERIIKILNASNKNKSDKNHFKIPEIFTTHFADKYHVEVSAASILAKVERDREIENLRKKYGDFGSGYPSDPKTVEYIKTNKNIPREIIRKSWNLSFTSPKQKKLSEF